MQTISAGKQYITLFISQFVFSLMKKLKIKFAKEIQQPEI